MATVPEQKVFGSYDYPTSDGRPMAETELHRDITIDVLQALQQHFADRPEVHVTGDLIVCYEEGNKRKHLAPDIFVVRGVPVGRRLNYLIWQEGKPPEVVIEITSSSTRREDLGVKMDLYRDQLKVREYFLFDPTGDYLDPILQGYRLRAGFYREIRRRDDRLPSQILGLELLQMGEWLRFYDPVNERILPTLLEITQQERQRATLAEQQAERERQQAERERQRAESAEAELARVRAEIERLRKQSGD